MSLKHLYHISSLPLGHCYKTCTTPISTNIYTTHVEEIPFVRDHYFVHSEIPAYPDPDFDPEQSCRLLVLQIVSLLTLRLMQIGLAIIIWSGCRKIYLSMV